MLNAVEAVVLTAVAVDCAVDAVLNALDAAVLAASAVD